jgi:hypothetical protein
MIRPFVKMTAILAVCLTLSAQPVTRTGLDQRVDAIKLSLVTPFEALLQIGQRYRIPLGIVVGDKQIVTPVAEISVPQGDLRSALQAIMVFTPLYSWKQEQGVIVVAEVHPSAETRFLPSLVIRSFISPPSTVRQLSNQLWMSVQAELDPTRSGFWGVIHNDDQQLVAPIKEKNASVEHILNDVVRYRRTAAWIILPPPPRIVDAPEDRLWGILTYADPSEPVEKLCCLNRSFLR